MALINLELENDEQLLFAQPANHVKKFESVGGKIFITNKRVAFRSHIFNIQTHKEAIYYNTIKEVSFYNSLGLVPNGLKITLADGTQEKYAVWNRKKIKELIDTRLG